MLSKIRLVALLAVVSSGFGAASLAQPVVNAVTWDGLPGTTISIAGANFGTKAVAEPMIWDDMESGSFDGAWQSSGQISIDGAAPVQRTAASNYCGFANMGSTDPAGGTGWAYFTGPNAQVAESWFVQYWFMLDDDFDWGTSGYGGGDENLANVKFFRMWSPENIDENFVMAVHGWAGSGRVAYSVENVTDDGGGYWQAEAHNWDKGVWHLLQFEYRESSINVNDGVIRVWLDGQLELENTGLKTREAYANLKRPFIVGFYDSWNDEGADRDGFYIDDVYVDRSWSRVEIGDNSTYTACSTREVLIPSSWSTNSIEVNASYGGFQSGNSVYLFVTDSNGNRSEGYGPIVLAEGVDPGPPGQPDAIILELAE